MSSVAEIETKYLAIYENQHLLGAISVWGSFLAGDKRYLKKNNKYHLIDMGNAEMILPLSGTVGKAGMNFRIPYKGKHLSELHKNNISTLRKQSKMLSFSRSFNRGEFSRKFRYNRRRELKQFTDQGGEVLSLSLLTAKEISELYIDLFEKRWNKKPRAHAVLTDFLSMVYPLIKGYYLKMNGKPIAIQLIYLTENENNISAEYINGGVDPDFRKYSPGSILSYLNIQLFEEMAAQGNCPLRFSFGQTDHKYKDMWCDSHPIYIN